MWTKRTGNGDTLSAQEWLDGRVLDPEEIGQRNDVIDVLYHLHHSKTLAKMLSKIGGQVMTPEKMLVEYEENLPKAVVQNRFIAIVYRYLERIFQNFRNKRPPSFMGMSITVIGLFAKTICIWLIGIRSCLRIPQWISVRS